MPRFVKSGRVGAIGRIETTNGITERIAFRRSASLVHPHGTSIERSQRYIFVHRPLCGVWHVAHLRETDGRGPIDRILPRAVRRTCAAALKGRQNCRTAR